MKRCLRLFFSLLCFLTVVYMRGVQAQTINTVAGKIDVPGTSGQGDGGPATSARFTNLNYLAFAADRIGSFYVADDGGYSIRKIDKSGIITRVAGNGTQGSGAESGDGGPGRAGQRG